MSGVVISKKKGSLILYIDDYKIGSTGYLISYIKGDSSRGISSQCRVKVIDSMVFWNIENSKKYFMELKRKYSGKFYHQFVMHCTDRIIVMCVQMTSCWEIDLLQPEDINHILLYCNTNFDKDPRNDIIIFNND